MSAHSNEDYPSAATIQIDWCTCCPGTGVHIHLVDKDGRIFACAVPDDIEGVIDAIRRAQATRAQAKAAGIITSSGRMQ